MKRILLIALAVAGYIAYRRYTEEKGGYEATAAAEPFSSDSLSDNGTPAPAPPAESEGAPPTDNTKDTLEQPTWLEPADGGEPADGDDAA